MMMRARLLKIAEDLGKTAQPEMKKGKHAETNIQGHSTRKPKGLTKCRKKTDKLNL